MLSPRFSVVVTCYNQRPFIRHAVDSAISQAHTSKEIVVVDDGSTDGSREVLEAYSDQIRLAVLPANVGAVGARNNGAAMARGEYLVFLDGDDVLLPWALEVYERLISERIPTIIGGMTRWFNGQVPCIGRSEIPQQIDFVDYDGFLRKDRPYGMCSSVLVVRRDTFSAVGGWSPGIFQLDLQDLATKLGFIGRAILICSPPTALYRIHDGNSIHNVSPFLRNLRRLISKERGGDYPGGRAYRFERRAWLGGLTIFWIQRALRAHLMKDAFAVALLARSMILAAIVRRSAECIRGRRPVESLPLVTASTFVSANGQSPVL